MNIIDVNTIKVAEAMGKKYVILPPEAEISEEGKEAYKEQGYLCPSERGFFLTQDFANIHWQQGNDLDLRWLGMQLYMAGELAGIRKERARRKGKKQNDTKQYTEGDNRGVGSSK